MRTARGSGWSIQGTPKTYLEPLLAHRGWTWAWEGEDLALDLPGWVQPALVREWVQPGLFTESEI